MSSIISQADKITPPTVYVSLQGKQVKRVEEYKVGQKCEVELKGMLKAKTVNRTDGEGLSGELVLEVYQLNLIPVDGMYSDLVEENDDA